MCNQVSRIKEELSNDTWFFFLLINDYELYRLKYVEWHEYGRACYKFLKCAYAGTVNKNYLQDTETVIL